MTTGVVFTLAMIAAAGCGSSHPSATPEGSARPAPSVSHTVISTVIQGNGGANPEASIPNPGTGKGNPALLRALLPLPRTAGGRPSPAVLPPAVVSLPDTSLKSMYVGLRQVGSPVTGPPECQAWTAGLSTPVLARFNHSGVQLGVGLHATPGGTAPVSAAETIITGPSSVLSALADPPLPASCRAITAETSQPGGVRPLSLARAGLRSRAYEVTGTGKNPVWLWGEVVSGPGFLLEIRIPVQPAAPDSAMPARLTAITASAYQRALAALGSR